MDSQKQETKVLTRKTNWWQIVAVLIIVAGAVMTVWSAQQQENIQRTDLLTKTRLAELGTSAGQVKALSGSSTDLTSPDYRALKAQLERIRAVTPQVRFVYLMGQRPDEAIFFYADSEPPSSGDYSPAGQDYPEASAGITQIFTTGVETTEGPYSDRWGTWVSGFVPVTDPTNGNVVAVFGMDIDAADWNLLIFKASLPTLIATLLILLLVLVSARFQQRSEEEKRRIANSEELLREKEAFQRVLLDNLTSGIFIVDAKSHIIELVNPTAAALIGTTPDQIIGKKCHLFLCPADEGACPITDLHLDVDNAERVMLRYDGTTIPVLKSVKKILVGGQEKLLENFIDISRRKETEAALERQTTTLSILNEIISAANKAEDLPQLLASILEESLRLLNFDAGGIYLIDRSTRTANIVHSMNLPPEFLAEIRTVPIDEKPYYTLFIKNEPIITGNFEQINPKLSKKFGFLSMASIPLLSKGVAIGALNIASTRRHVISEAEKQTLVSISWELGSTIERMAAEEEVKKASKNLETLFNSIDEMVFVLDLQGRILAVNSTVQKRLLYTPEELTGTNVLLLHIPERRDEALRIVQGMIAGTIDSCPVPVVAKDGTRIEVETKVTRGIWNGNDVLIGVTRDITERKQAAEALMASKDQFRLLLDSTAEAIYGLDMKGDCTFCNSACLRLLGYPNQDELIGKNMHRQIHHKRPDGSPFPVEECRIFQAFIKGEGTHVDDEVLWRADGISFPAEYWSYPQHRNGAVVGAVVTFLDITERKLAEEKLAHRTALLINLLDSIPDIVFFKDINGVYLGCNPHFAEFVGRTQEEIIGHTDYDLFTKDIADSFRQNDQAMMAQINPRHNEEWIDYPDGHRELIDTFKAPLRTLDGSVIGLLGISRDITERKQIEQAIFEANKKLNILNSITRHDVLNQITALDMMLALINDSITDTESLDFVKKAQDSTERITRQIQFTREYQDIGVQSPQWQNVSVLVTDAKNLLTTCPFTIRIDTGMLEIYADPLLNKVFYNLLENAVRHGETVSQIRFSAQESNNGLQLIYEDNGVGVDEKSKKNLFRQGFGKHTGFGLYLMKEILAITGITITETGEPGKGARFEILVPKGGYRFSSA